MQIFAKTVQKTHGYVKSLVKEYLTTSKIQLEKYGKLKKGVDNHNTEVYNIGKGVIR
jgi:hypothetical protein